MIDQISAGLGLLVCMVLLLRMAIGPTRRHRLDQFCRRRIDALRRRLVALRRRTPAPRSIDPDAAQREAQDLIERARRARPDAERDGNVVRPRAFDPSKRKPPLH